MKEETLRRGFEPTENFTDDESHVTDTDGYKPRANAPLSPQATVSPRVEANTQDPDSDLHQIKEAYADTALAFLKDMKTKGHIKMLTENEVVFVKKLLKDVTHEYWKEANIVEELHRHSKYTIRRITRQMANIENYKIFRKLKDPTRENVLYMIYRAERLYAAMAHAEKIFEMVSQIIFDRE